MIIVSEKNQYYLKFFINYGSSFKSKFLKVFKEYNLRIYYINKIIVYVVLLYINFLFDAFFLKR